MAELGIVASVLQIADIGLRLSLRLYTFGETVASADKSIISISKDVSLTSNVLKELGQTLDRDQSSRIYSPHGVSMADSIVKECMDIFQEMDQVLVKKFANTKSVEKDRMVKAIQTLDRLRWPFIKSRMVLLTSNLERQKTTLVLLLNVIALAKQHYEKTDPPLIIAEQRSLIQDLVKSNEGYIRRFEQLRLGCEDTSIDPEVDSESYINLMPMLKAPPARGVAGAPAKGAAGQEDPNTGAQGLSPENTKRPADFGISGVFSSDQLSRLLQQYSLLMSTLVTEVSAPKYEIAEDSRSRIKSKIVLTHQQEMRRLEWDGVKKRCNKRTQKPVQPKARDRTYRDEPEDVRNDTTERIHNNISDNSALRANYTVSPPPREQKALDASHTPTLREISPSKNEYPSPSPSSHPQPSSKNGSHENLATVTEYTPILEQGVGDSVQYNSFSCPPASGTTSTSKGNAVYSREERNQMLPGEKSLNYRHENDLMEERAEDVVDNLLIMWTTLPSVALPLELIRS